MRVDFTCRRFPVTGSLKQQCGLPFSCVIQPFAKVEGPDAAAEQAPLPPVDDIVRCKKCFAYVNCFCSFSPVGWTCSLCGTTTTFSPYTQNRYQRSADQLSQLPETRNYVYEATVGEPVPIEAGPGGFSGPAPVYLALVDVGAAGSGGGSDFVDLVRSSLEAALEALPAAALFGLITFSDKLCLHDLRSTTPTARVVPLQAASSSPSGIVQALLPLAEVMPLKSLLAPVAAFKDRIAEALEFLVADSIPTPLGHGSAAGLQVSGSGSQGAGPAPAQISEMTRAAGPAQGSGVGPMRSGGSGLAGPGSAGACRALGPALLAVLDYLKAVQRPPFQPASADALSHAASEGGGGRGAGGSVAAGAQAMADLLPPAVSPVHLMLFLSGPPDLGPGRVATPRRNKLSAAEAGVVRAPQAGAAGDAAAEQLRLLALQQAEAASLQVPGGYLEPSPEARRFYEGAAVAAAALGVCVDVFAVSPGAVGLTALEALAASTGGATYLYLSAEDSALPQDVYRRLSCPRATAGLLRVRASHGFKPVRYYGRLFADSQFDNLHHIISCDTSDTFAVDFEHSNKTMGFAAEDVILQPTLQVAFQYSTVVSLPTHAATPHSNGAGPGSSLSGTSPPTASNHRLALVRRLRVVTHRMSVTRDAMDLYRNCSTDAVLCLLVHKVARLTLGVGPPPPLPPQHPTGKALTHPSTGAPFSAPQHQGAGAGRESGGMGASQAVDALVSPQLAQARTLVRDWLVLLVAGYQRAKHPSASLKQLAAQQPDLSFSEAPALQRIPCLVYALLRSPLLASPPEEKAQHPDLAPFIRQLWACLPPSELQAAVYPSLSSWLGPDVRGQQEHTLSRDSLRAAPGTAPPPLFLLDAYIIIMVFYTSAAAAAAAAGGLSPPLAFPPPQGSGLARAIGAIRQGRRITPKVRYVREGTDEAESFFHLLLDEPELPISPSQGAGSEGASTGAGSSTHFGLSRFLEHVRNEVLVHLSGEAEQG